MLTQNLHSQERKMLDNKKKLRWFVTLSTLPLLGVVTAFGLVPQSNLDLTSTKLAIEEITLPQVVLEESTTTSYWRNERVQRGDTVDELLHRLSIEDAAASIAREVAATASRHTAIRIVNATADQGGIRGGVIGA